MNMSIIIRLKFCVPEVKKFNIGCPEINQFLYLFGVKVFSVIRFLLNYHACNDKRMYILKVLLTTDLGLSTSVSDNVKSNILLAMKYAYIENVITSGSKMMVLLATDYDLLLKRKLKTTLDVYIGPQKAQIPIP